MGGSLKNGTCNLRGNTGSPTLIAIYSKTYRNISTTQTILDTPDKSLYTDNHITDVGVIGRKWQQFKKTTSSTNFMKKKIWYFHLSYRTFILRPIGQWANLIVSSVAMCSELSNATSYIPLLQLSDKLLNFALTPSWTPRQRSVCLPPHYGPSSTDALAWRRLGTLNWTELKTPISLPIRCRYAPLVLSIYEVTGDAGRLFFASVMETRWTWRWRIIATLSLMRL